MDALEFHGTHFALRIESDDLQTAGSQQRHKGRINAVVAAELFLGFSPAINFREVRALFEADTLRATDERTGQARDGLVLGIRLIFGMNRVAIAQGVGNVFENQMLKAGAGAE